MFLKRDSRKATALMLLWMAPVAAAQAPAASKPASAMSPAPVAVAQAPAGAKSAPSESAKPAEVQEAPAKTAAKIEPEKEAAIRKLMDAQGTRKAMADVVAGMSAKMRPTLTQALPPGDYREKLIDLFFQKFQANLNIDDLVALSISAYDKYFTKEDIAGLTEFFQTPLGKKMSSVLPELTIETQAAAQAMGEQLGRQSMLEVLAEHPDLAKALEEASAPKN